MSDKNRQAVEMSFRRSVCFALSAAMGEAMRVDRLNHLKAYKAHVPLAYIENSNGNLDNEMNFAFLGCFRQ